MLSECDSDLLADLGTVLGRCRESWTEAHSNALELVAEPSLQHHGPIRIAAAGRVFFHGQDWLPVLGTLARFGFLNSAVRGSAEREEGDIVLFLIRQDYEYLVARLGSRTV
jgi:hypothetical protein